ncbi:aspartate aminotransferase family protein [Sporobolomyces salmoneus]|uniref:aspartate aminotransferase family protein n=1 Tax=Sporobolomyces salmoneus TaxID=183962 RepID=UPI0031785FF6
MLSSTRSSVLRISSPRSLSIAPHHRFLSSSFPSLASAKANMDYLTPTHLDDDVPSSISQTLQRHSSVTLNTYSRPSFILSRGKGCKVWDTENREYLDFSGGIAVNALGHSDEGVAKIVAEQADQLVHCSNLWHNEHSGELAYSLVEQTKKLGGMGYDKAKGEENGTADEGGLKIFFTNSGTESNEGAIKFARKYGKQIQLLRSAKEEPGVTKPTESINEKVEIVSFRDGFHGRSMGALSATWQEKYQAPFAPLVPGFVPATLNDIQGINEAVTEKTCGVIVEPIQGEGGILEASEEFLRALRKRCDEVGALLIFDEIQCGLGRTGSFWAHGSFPTDCHPDVLTMAKPLANGLPIGAILMKDKVADVIKIGDHGTTFGGAPLQTRVAHHVVGRIASPSFLSSVSRVGSSLSSRLSALPSLFPRLIAGPPRGRGLILGLPLTSDHAVQRLVKLMRERGVLVLSCGKSTVRFVPSLIVTEEEVERCVDTLESCLVVMNRESEGL